MKVLLSSSLFFIGKLSLPRAIRTVHQKNKGGKSVTSIDDQAIVQKNKSCHML